MYFVLILVLIILTSIFLSNGFIWNRTDGPAKTLECPNFCQTERIEENECCICHGVPLTVPIGNVLIEYIDLEGRSDVITDGSKHYGNDTLKLVHTNGKMSRLPENICEFKIFELDLSYNEIDTLDGLNCLDILDKLTMKGNRIVYIANNTFAGMEKLRVVDLSQNRIKYMEPGTLSAQGTEIYFADFSENSFAVIDVSNIYIENGLRCNTNYTNAINGIFTNLKNMTIKANSSYTSGDVSFINASMSYTQAFNTMVEMVPSGLKVEATGTLKFSEITIPCDCEAGKLVNAVKTIRRLWYTIKAQMPGFYCESPPHLQNVFINLTQDLSDLEHMEEELVCKRSDGLCPYTCICIDQPYRNRYLVNCTARGLAELPHRLPQSDYPYDLLFDMNNITSLEGRGYLDTTVSIDISSNPLCSISESAIDKIRESPVQSIHLDGHQISRLPKELLHLNSSIFLFGKNSVGCSCDDLWIKTWRRLTNVDKNNSLYCHTIDAETKQIISADDITENLVGCKTDTHENYTLSAILTCLAVLLSTVLLLLFFFKGDLRLACRHLSRKGQDELDMDLFVSFDEENGDIRRFLCHDLYSELLRCGFRVIIPCLHILPGEERERAMYNELKHCNYFMVVLSSEYLSTPSMKQEFDGIKHLYVTDRRRKCFFLKFENVKLKIFNDPAIRTMCRYNSVVDVVNRYYKIIPEIKEILGLSRHKSKTKTEKQIRYSVNTSISNPTVRRTKFNSVSVNDAENSKTEEDEVDVFHIKWI